MSDNMKQAALSNIDALIKAYNALHDNDSIIPIQDEARGIIIKLTKYFTALAKTNPGFFTSIVSQYKHTNFVSF